MKRVRLDFAPPGLRRALFHAGARAWLPALGGLALCGAAAVQVLDYNEAREQVDAQLAAVRARSVQLVAPPPLRPADAIPAPRAAAVNAAVNQLNLPWRALHDAVRGATPSAIALLALEPDAKKSVLRISAEARNSDDMLAYVEALGREQWFASVVLTRHEVMETDPNRPLRFQIDASWRAP